MNKMPKLRSKVDANQAEIVKIFRSAGASVCCTHMLGRGFPDLVVGWGGQNILIEVKDGSKPPSQRKLTADEKAFHANWQGRIEIVESIEDVYNILKGG